MGKPSSKKRKSKEGRKNPQFKRRNSAKHVGRKSKRKTRFWIETCKEKKLPGSRSAQATNTVTVLITRVLLEDNHTHRASSKSSLDVLKCKENQTTETKSLPTSAAGPPAQSTPVASLEPKDALEKKSIQKGLEGPMFPLHKEKEQSASIDKAVPKNKAQATAVVAVRRTLSAIGPIPLHPYPTGHFIPLPNGDCGDGVCNPNEKKIVPDKYWAQRKRLFSRFDDGIQLSRDGWYSVTPEEIANHIAARFVSGCSTTKKGCLVILDAFAGCGGNSIAFANRPEVSLVICVDLVLNKLKMAAHNASVYGIDKDKLIFVHGDAMAVLETYQSGIRTSGEDCDAGNVENPVKELAGYRFGNLATLPDRIHGIFLSPPWGGLDYLVSDFGRGFDIEASIQIDRLADCDEKEVNGRSLLQTALNASTNVAYFLPRNVDGIALAKSVLKTGYTAGSFELEQNVLNSKLKTVTAYFGLW